VRKKINKPKILVFDLEVTAHEGYYWGKNWETDIIERIKFGQILSYAAKWLGKRTFVRGWIDYKRNKELRLVKELRELLDKADIVVGQNIKSFDIKWCNAAFLRYDLSPPSPYGVVDTKTEAKKYLYLPSYKLNNIADYFGIGRKMEHEGFPLWTKCIKGDRKAWGKMKKYNKIDVELTEKVFLKLRPFIKSLNLSTLKRDFSCPRCGSDRLQSRGYWITASARYQRFACLDCGGWFSRTKAVREKWEKTKAI